MSANSLISTNDEGNKISYYRMSFVQTPSFGTIPFATNYWGWFGITFSNFIILCFVRTPSLGAAPIAVHCWVNDLGATSFNFMILIIRYIIIKVCTFVITLPKTHLFRTPSLNCSNLDLPLAIK